MPRNPSRFTGVVLCGGAGSRLGGRNKAFINLGSQCFLERLRNTLAPLVDELLLVARDPDVFADFAERTVTDIYTARSALTGIHAGLKNIATPHAFFVACDAPLLRPALVRGLMHQATPETDAVVPEYEGYLEPLCAVYSRQCLPAIERLLDSGTYQIRKLYPLIRVKTVGKPFLLELDPHLESFLNVNTEEDLRKLQEKF